MCCGLAHYWCWCWQTMNTAHQHTHTHTHIRLTALCLGLPGWASTRKVKPIWILLKQETVSGSGICWAICKSAPRSRQITTPAPHHSVFYRPDALPATQPTASKHWRLTITCNLFTHQHGWTNFSACFTRELLHLQNCVVSLNWLFMWPSYFSDASATYVCMTSICSGIVGHSKALFSYSESCSFFRNRLTNYTSRCSLECMCVIFSEKSVGLWL